MAIMLATLKELILPVALLLLVVSFLFLNKTKG